MDDELIIERIRGGEGEAFSLLVNDHIFTAYKVSYLVLGTREYAEDAVQNALFDAYLSITKGYPIKNFKTWFLRLVYNRSVDLYRSNKRKSYMVFEDNYYSDEKTKSIQEMLIQNENKQEISNLLHKLDIDQRLPLLLYYFEEMSLKEISIVLNVNLNTLKSRLKRGKRKISQLIKMEDRSSLEVKTYEL
ncbi:RNA polymerase sigma factor [Bacillus sp. CGMCC 1.16607]|uniref:RNA polymerase sigma factor n=1 Tax=Bacillus sp. CGMCC 1.16607 TaxID=3351842 RepID=UPI003643C889